MYSLVALVHLDGDGASAAEQLVGLGAAVAPTMEGNFNGGDLIARFSFADEAGYRALQPAIETILAGNGVARADTAFYRNGAGSVGAPGLADGVYRALLLNACRPQSVAKRAQFDAEMVLMPKYIPAIRNWRYSPVIEASGERPWTHVWEQEYAGIEGLMGPYMLHPYHWAVIDRWFDPECPDWLVDTRLCHSFGAFGRPQLS